MEDNEEITEPLTKPKKPRTQKQIEAFQETTRKRNENVELRKQEKLIKASEILVNNSKQKQISIKPKPIPQKQVQLSSESESEEEIIIVKAKPKKKKKIKKIIIESSESDSDSGSGSDGGNIGRYKPQKISIQREYQRPVFNSNNFFV